MPVGKSIRVYLADATVTGIRYAELVNWTGHAIACPRNRLSELSNWQEASKPGVYFLFEGRFRDSKPLAYIGESENVLQRLTNHDRSKDFWNEAVIFTSKDENLTKAHIKYLESSLVVLSKNADRYQLENSNTPPESSLPRADRDAMAEFVENIRMVLGILGYQILEPILPVRTAVPVGDTALMVAPEVPQVTDLTFSVNGLLAFGAMTDEGFVLKKGSQLSSTNSLSVPGRVAIIKERLLKDGLVAHDGNRLVATTDILLTSSTYAAAIVAGTSRSGPQSWKTRDGRTLKELEDALVQQ
ncbi:GIY-YIG nuclease family protein [Burkholderia oklahomensis]|uniref:GIY-YIG nuclease family protein n=1 Tax=Burkholderia oklahomensis TaxID=342113 RepID=UPI00265499AE|nr:GIY-YIG nuclease family protein [Burkholderia oklahomensis]MDN7674082.1 GIY-YIG nuclease family protein [Burkholderia oklahomensis]